MSSGPPYASAVAGVGGLPNTTVDRIVTSVFLVLYVCGAAAHMTILQLNLRRSHKFLASGALFGFCMSRIATTTLRLVWGTYPTNIRVAIAANIFVNAGVIILIILNLIFAQRILRASHPRLGWTRTIHFVFLAYYASMILNIGMVIVAIIQQSYTLNANILQIDHDLLLTGGTYSAVASFMPLPILILSTLTRHIRPRSKPAARVEKFGEGRFRTKLIILLVSASLICIGAVFRTTTAYFPRPATDPAWYHSKACFYCFNFTIEIIVIYLYALLRIDRRFHIPNGSKRAGDYVNGTGAEAGNSGVDSQEVYGRISEGRSRTIVETEEEVERDFAPEQDDSEPDVEKPNERPIDGSLEERTAGR